MAIKQLRMEGADGWKRFELFERGAAVRSRLRSLILRKNKLVARTQSMP